MLRLLQIATAGILLIQFSASLHAQSQTTGRIAGSVRDPTGAVIEAARSPQRICELVKTAPRRRTLKAITRSRFCRLETITSSSELPDSLEPFWTMCRCSSRRLQQ